MSDTTTKENTVSPSQVVRELASLLLQKGCQFARSRPRYVSETIDEFASHIDQVVAPYREALESELAILVYERERHPGMFQSSPEYVALNGRIETIRAALSASPIPGAKAEETAGAEFWKKALEQALQFVRFADDSIMFDAGHSYAEDAPELANYLRTKEQA